MMSFEELRYFIYMDECEKQQRQEQAAKLYNDNVELNNLIMGAEATTNEKDDIKR